jgi:hypothetical protein
MLNPAYSLDEQVEELLEKAEYLLSKAALPTTMQYARETWVDDLLAFRQRRLIAEAAAQSGFVSWQFEAAKRKEIRDEALGRKRRA